LVFGAKHQFGANQLLQSLAISGNLWQSLASDSTTEEIICIESSEKSASENVSRVLRSKQPFWKRGPDLSWSAPADSLVWARTTKRDEQLPKQLLRFFFWNTKTFLIEKKKKS